MGHGGAAGGYSSHPTNQPPPPGTTSWLPDAATPALPPVQGIGATGYQTQYPGQFQAYPPQPVDSAPAPDKLFVSNNANQGNIIYSQPPNMHVSSTNQFQQAPEIPQRQLPPPPPPPYTVQMPDMHQVQGGSHLHPNMVQMPDTRQVSKMQIPTNPRIAPGLATGAVKVDRGSISTSGLAKPAYVSVSVSKSDTKLASTAEDADKGAFPVSLKAYVERSFARCKTDVQRNANQNRLKEVITKATTEGTLFSKNWDLEPLFPLPSGDSTNTNNTLDSTVFSSLNKEKRKSRWEPIEETPQKKVEPLSNTSNSGPSNTRYNRPEATPKTDGRNWNTMIFVKAQKHSNFNNSGPGRFKKQKTNVFIRKQTEHTDSSSDSDKERELTKYYSSAISLANSPEEKKKREHRSKRFDKRRIESATPNNSSSIVTRKANAMLLAKSYDDNNGPDQAVEDIDWDSLTVKGTCQEIEKRYLRLTSAPDPSTVRPEEVLEKALEMVQTSSKNYLYKCDQLKSIRQDLTVQRIENELTVKVYETHARLAIQFGDIYEYNQCQSQLKRLYAEGIKGCDNEFSAYHLLHVCLHSNNKRDLLSSMAGLSIQSKQDDAVKHALKVRSAVSSGNYLLYFRLYKAAPNLNTCLMDLYVENIRFEAVKSMSKAYRPTLPVRYVAQVLGFVKNSEEKESETTDRSGFEECEQWLKAHGAVLTSDSTGDLQLDGKASMNTLYMPEPENAVSHGDASLAVDDFLTRAP
ncbi:SAC3/GANP/Nin1/mts3/eIF-3 p25 family isoform X2 [Carex rostrata]